MRIFSTFTGIGGFEIGIHNAWLRSQDKGQTVQGTQARNSQGRSEQLHKYGDEGLSFIGYSEIDKYAIKVYERHFKQKRSREERGCEFAELRTNISNKNYDIISVWKQNYANAVDRLKINRQEEGSGRGAELAETNIIETDTKATQKSKNASKNKQQILSEETQKKLSNILSDITLCEDSECSICTEDNVFVVESNKRSSSHLNTETEMDILTENDMELAICISSPSKSTTRKSTKSYAITVITLKEGTAYAHISREKPIPNFGDITKINAEELPDFDCLVGGFPCQAFSIAGKRGGFDDTRGTLFFDLARILQAKQPRLFVFENVKGLLSHDGGRTFATIISTIDELGYDAQWQIVNSKDFGVPQNRERIIIVGHLRGTPRPEVFPLSGGDPASTREDTVVRDVAQTVTASYQKGWKGSNVLVDALYASRPARIYKEVAPAVINHGSGGNKMPMVVDYKHPKSETRRGRLKEGYVGTLDTDVQTGILEGGEIRRLTPLECERLQGFPDDWTKYGVDEDKALKDDRGYYTKETIWDYPVLKYIKKIVRHEEPLVLISDAQRYKMCGNAVTTNVIQAVFERILIDEARSL